MQALGPGGVDGVPSTKYLITDAPIAVCAHGRTVSLPLISPTTIWVDHQGRLVQARVATHDAGGRVHAGVLKLIGGSSSRATPSTTVTTLTFSDFGAPVHVAAPATSGVEHGGSVSIAFRAKSANGACGA
ncbi:MAG TPA: hypothetical protein VG346_11610 [Acidimicrobiales bacterium]|nr:hypothetical protein [Acidimicrobiales bacterium]